MRTAIWIVGEPAAGKSYRARIILGELSNLMLGKQKWCLGTHSGYIAPGHYGVGNFDGADQVGMSQARAYLDQYLGTPEHLSPRQGILLDGARFSTRPCFDLLAQTHKTAVIFLSSPECEARRRARGWDPDAKWLKGAITRAERFRDYAAAHGADLLT